MSNTIFDELARYMRLTVEQRRAEDMAQYPYLPTQGLLEAVGYEHTHVGRYYLKTPFGFRYELSFFSQSGSCVLQKIGGLLPTHDWIVVGHRVLANDAELVAFLRAHNFPCPDLT